MTRNQVCCTADLKLGAHRESFSLLICENVILNHSFKRMWFCKIKETFNIKGKRIFIIYALSTLKGFLRWLKILKPV